MANQLDPMDIKQIISLHRDGLSNREVSSLLGISRNTINNYVNYVKCCEHSLEALLQMDVGALKELFTRHTTIDNERYEELMKFFDQMNAHKEHKGFTFQYHYEDYVLSSENPYGYTQFLEHYHRKYPKQKGSMKLTHTPGKELYIDFCGKLLHIVDRDTGEEIPVQVFVGLLPFSQYTYVQACRTQKREDLLDCLGKALKFYGGVPKAIVSDNLKSAVTRSCKYEPVINRSLKDFATHHRCVINPTRAYAPQDKALVENAVQLVYQRIYYPIREMTFFSLEELNQEIAKRLEVYNDLLFQKKSHSRKELFQSLERTSLKPLDAPDYQIKDYRRAKVQKMGYVYFSPDKSYYSVPYRFIGKMTMLHYTHTTVEVYHNHKRIAVHHRNTLRGSYNTIKDHLSSTHQAFSQWSPSHFINKAQAHGAQVVRLFTRMFTDEEYPERSYKKAIGILQLHKDYGNDRLDAACKLALELQTTSYHRIKNILKNNMDQMDTEAQIDFESHIPIHQNLRGQSYYH